MTKKEEKERRRKQKQDLEETSPEESQLEGEPRAGPEGASPEGEPEREPGGEPEPKKGPERKPEPEKRPGEKSPPPEGPTKEVGTVERKRDDYANLVKKFEESTKDSIDSYQESGPRELYIVSVYCDSRSGLFCATDERGIPHIIVTGVEPGPQKKKIRQRFFMGIQTEAVTKGKAVKSENLRTKKAPKPFDIAPQVDQLLKATIPVAQDEGDKIQRKIDEENYEYFPVYLTPPEVNIVAEDIEPDPDLETVKDLVAYARGEVADRLGAKGEKIDVELAKITEHMLYADSLGSQTDLVFPRVSFSIVVKTKEGNTAIGVIRGAGGTIEEILARYVDKDSSKEERESKAVISKLVDQVVKEAIDLDRAQTTTVIGASECPVILSSQVGGVLAHEVFGHVAEADIICQNRRKKDVGVQLKSRIGSQVSDYPRLSIIDTPEQDVKLGEKEIRYNWGAIPVDGYGNQGKVAQLIEKGTMIGCLVDRCTFNEIIHGLRDPEPIKSIGVTGNVRREKFDQSPKIRMRSTFILPDETGPSSKEEMAKLIPATKKGLYVKSCFGGSVNPDSGDFQINANLCYLIENRQVTEKPVKNVTITGNIKQIGMIKSIGAAKTMQDTFPGWCSKDGQTIPVDAGSPLIYIESARLAGGAYRPWLEIVEDYVNQHRKVQKGAMGPEVINVPEFREMVGDKEPQNKVCMLTAVLPKAEEPKYLMGTEDYSTHEIDENGKLVERRDRYE